MSRPRRYPDETKQQAIALAVEHGPAYAARVLGINPATVRQWAKRAGVVTVTNQKMTEAREAVQITREQRRERLADRLLELAELSAERCAAEMADAKIRDLVGLFTRAIHDHQLLTGAATTRTENLSRDQARQVIDELAARRAKAA